MAEFVVDSSVWITAFQGGEPRSDEALQFFSGVDSGQHVCHLPYLVLVATTCAIARQSARFPLARVEGITATFADWERAGALVWYGLDRSRSDTAMATGTEYRLRGSDAVIASLAIALDIPLKTFDAEMRNRLPEGRVQP